MGSNRENFNSDENGDSRAISKIKKKKMIRRKRRIKRFTSLLVISILVGVVALGIYVYSFLSGLNNNSLPGAVDPIGKNPVNVLLLGMDIGDAEQAESEVGRRTDTMMVLNYNPVTKKAKVISIPRDTMIEIDGAVDEYGQPQLYWKMNAAYAIGGDEEVTSQVEDILEVQINYLVKVDYNAFRNIVDAIGGVEMYIEQDMYYDDDAQDLHINFTAGETVNLDGKQAEEFFRWRQNNDGTGLENGDLDRIENQQKFMKAFMKKCISPSIVSKIPRILNVVSDSIDTNLDANQMLKYSMQLVKLKQEDLTMTRIQGENEDIDGQSYFVYYREMNLELLESLHSGDSLSNSGNEEVIDETDVGIDKAALKIMVLNATGINGLAGELQEELYNLGYMTIETGNAPNEEKSVIMTSNKEIKNLIKTDTGIKKVGKLSDPDYENYDAVIVLGKDYDLFGE